MSVTTSLWSSTLAGTDRSGCDDSRMGDSLNDIQIRSITSATNDRIKRIVRLRDQSAERRETGLFVVETMRELGRAVAAGYRVDSVFATEEGWGELRGNTAVWGALPSEPDELYQITDRLMEKVSYRRSSRGFVAILSSKDHRLDADALSSGGLYLVCGGLEKPGNLGAIFRTADACGIDHVFVDDEADLYHPNLIRASTGAVFELSVCRAGPQDIERSLKKPHGVRVIALSDEASEVYTDVDWTEPTAIVLGSEAEGVSPEWRAMADEAVSIPMRGVADSLNVSVAAAVVMYEAMRQRSSVD